MEAWRGLSTAPVMAYFFPATENETEREAAFQDLLAMGFTGVYKVDKSEPYGGRLFREKGLHGLMQQTKFGNSSYKPTLGPDGSPAVYRKEHPLRKSVFAKENVKNYLDEYVIGFARNYGPENLFHVGETLVMSSWDETGLYSREQIEYGYDARERFADYLREVIYGGEENALARFNAETGLNLTDWRELPMPVYMQRYDTPALWKRWIDFHAYFTADFFRQTGAVATRELGRDVEVFTFPHATAKWPGPSSAKGIDQFLLAKTNRLLTVEDCQADYPGSTIHYAFTDQLSRRYNRPVLGWSWFWGDADRHNDPLEIGRALARAMGHSTHGLLHWNYDPTFKDERFDWRKKPATRKALAYWHRTYQAHWPFLKSTVGEAPQVAVLFPRNSGNMYYHPVHQWVFPKQDFGWTCHLLNELHVPFEVVSDNQIEFEPSVLDDYRLLIAPTSAWQSPEVREAIAAFIARGGFVYTSGDGFVMDTRTGKAVPFLGEQFGIDLETKHRTLFAPTYDTAAEEEWSRGRVAELQTPKWEGGAKHYRPEEQFEPVELTDETLAEIRKALPDQGITGVWQTVWDPREEQMVRIEMKGREPVSHRTYHDILTGKARPGATVLARYGDDVAAVETERTVWTGFRPGWDAACEMPVPFMRSWGEPVWPYKYDPGVGNRGATARAVFAYVLSKAGIEPPLKVERNGEPAPEIEVRSRVGKDGNRMVWLINHGDTEASCSVKGDWLAKAEVVADVRSGKPIKVREGTTELKIPAGEVMMLALGEDRFVRNAQAAQARVARDLEALKTFAELEVGHEK